MTPIGKSMKIICRGGEVSKQGNYWGGIRDKVSAFWLVEPLR